MATRRNRHAQRRRFNDAALRTQAKSVRATSARICAGCAPTLVISGMLDDAEVLRASVLLAIDIPGAQHVRFPGAAHGDRCSPP